MTVQEYNLVKDAFEKKATILLGHENKELAVVGLPSTNYTEKKVKGKRFISVSTNNFIETILNVDSNLTEATKHFPDHFGKSDTSLVLEAIKKIAQKRNPYYIETRLDKEEFCLAYDVENMQEDKVLRMDLYREDKKTEFVGGLLHAFKHFNFNGIPLSTGKGEYPIGKPMFMIDYAIDAFFNYKFQPGKKPYTFTSTGTINGKSVRFIFYLEKTSGVYFISTIHII